jgi:hypothetical protein
MIAMADNSKHTITTAALFPDAAIEQLCGNRLVLCHAGQAQISSTVSYGGQTYGPAMLGGLEQAVYLPSVVGEFSNTDELVTDLAKAVTKVGLNEQTTLLLAISILATGFRTASRGS